MPSRKVHELVDLILFGRKFTMVHRLKDAPARVLGYAHRILYHDDLFNIALAMTSDNPIETYMAAKVHDILDWMWTRAKRRARRRL